MQAKMSRLSVKILIIGLVASSCLCWAQQLSQAPNEQPAAAAQTTSQSPSLIGALLREQASKQQQKHQLPTTTTTTTTTTPAALGLPPATTNLPWLSSSNLGAISTRVVPSALSPLFSTSTTAQSSAEQPQTATTTTTTTTTLATSTQQTAAASTATPTTSNYQFVKPMSAPKCHYNNQSYTIGQKWNDDCLQVCECILTDAATGQLPISACRPRCPVYRDPPAANCTLQRSKSDECCLDWNCDLDAKVAPTIMQTDQGQQNVSTTEIRMPVLRNTDQYQSEPAETVASLATTSAAVSTEAQPTTTTTTQAPTIAARMPSQTTITISKIQSSQMTTLKPNLIQRQSITTPQRQQVPTIITTTATAAPTTTTTSRSKPSNGAREPKTWPRNPESTTSAPTDTEPLEEVDPSLMDLCIQGQDKGFKLNDIWQVEPCNQTCRCVFRTEPRDPITDVSYYLTLNLKPNSTQTEIRCGLPKHCGSVMSKMVPSTDCPRPHLLLPQQQPFDKCSCPEVTCLPPPPPPTTSQRPSQDTTTGPIITTTRSKPTTLTTTTIPIATTETPKGCKSRQQGGRMLSIGEQFNDECHSTCRCTGNGVIRCEQLNCPTEPPADILCAEWMLEQNFKPSSNENKCCPQFVCKRPVFEEHHKEKHASTPSTQSHQPPKDPEPQFKSCLLLGKELPHGERVPEEMQPRSTDPCEKACVCTDGKIVCQPTCPPVSDTPPEDFDCPPAATHLISDECCSRWACQIKETFELQDFKVMPINATSAELSFVLPLFAVGQRGSFKLNYTETSESRDEIPEYAHWTQRSNISTSDGVFSSQLIKYYQGNLKPNHKYWFKVLVFFESQEPPFDEPIEGPLKSVLMPPREEPLATSTSKPTIMLQPVVSSTQRSPTTTTTTSLPLSTTTVSQAPSSTTSIPTTSTTKTTTTTTTSTTTQAPIITNDLEPIINIPKPDISSINERPITPCNSLDQTDRQPLPWTDQIQSQMNGPLQKHAWYLLVALSIMTILFTIVSYLYLKKSSRVIAPITSQSAYDNPTFTKLVSYYANQPHVLLVDESNQNFNNDVILAKQKNLEVDRHHPHHHGRQNLI